MRTQIAKPCAYGLTEPAFETIAQDGITDRAGRRESDERPSRIGVKQAKSSEKGAGMAGAAIIHFSKIARSEEPDTLRKACDQLTFPN